jgi:integral membrane sensor domain MASE1
MNWILPWMMLGHFVSDFVFQSNWMASNKSKNLDALFSHTMAYTFTMVVFLGFYTQFRFNYPPGIVVPLWAVFSIVTFSTHTLTDFVTSRITSVIFESAMQDFKQDLRNEFSRKYHDYFVVIGLDQLIHFLSIWATLYALNLL